MSNPTIAFHSTDKSLTSSPINPDWIREGTPKARNRILERSSDSLACTILWDCTAGKFDWFYGFDETVHILEGNVVLSDDHTPPRRLGPGDMVFFPKGSHAHWQVETYVRKLAFCHRTLPRFVQGPISFLRKLKAVLRGDDGPGLMDAGPGKPNDCEGVGRAAQGI
jgi:uncharacterized cupin superfamily protein